MSNELIPAERIETKILLLRGPRGLPGGRPERGQNVVIKGGKRPAVRAAYRGQERLKRCVCPAR